MTLFRLDVVTPNANVYSDDITMLIVKTVDGEMGILARHIPILAPIVAFTIRMYKGDQVEELIIKDGFLEVKPDGKVVILTDAAETTKRKNPDE